MKILIDHHDPFALAHGGFQVQIEQTKAALERAGANVECVRWWDASQQGQLIHFFGPAPLGFLQQARLKGIPVVMTHLFTATCNRSDSQLRRQGWIVRAILGIPFGEGIKQQLIWRSFGACARNVVGIEAERRVLELVYGIGRNRVSVVPLGLSDTFLKAPCGSRTESHLVCAGTITERKNCVPLARLARAAKVPVLFIGKPYSDRDAYWKEFQSLLDGQWVRHQPHVGDPAAMVELLGRARGAVIMSEFENWCLAAHEAIACGLPLLVQDQKWSRERFGDQVRYFKHIGESEENVRVLRQFYVDSPGLPVPAIKLYGWDEVALQLLAVYREVLSTSR